MSVTTIGAVTIERRDGRHFCGLLRIPERQFPLLWTAVLPPPGDMNVYVEFFESVGKRDGPLDIGTQFKDWTDAVLHALSRKET